MEDTPKRPRRLLTAFLVLLPIAIVSIVVLWFCATGPVTTVILVRHAERANATDTTSLSPEGFERAQTLAHVLGTSGIQMIIVSDRVRTQQTAAPLAASTGIMPLILPAQNSAAVLDTVAAHGGKRILIVGHSDTVPALLDGLGIDPAPAIAPTEFDNLFMVSKVGWRSWLVHARYGRPT